MPPIKVMLICLCKLHGMLYKINMNLHGITQLKKVNYHGGRGGSIPLPTDIFIFGGSGVGLIGILSELNSRSNL